MRACPLAALLLALACGGGKASDPAQPDGGLGSGGDSADVLPGRVSWGEVLFVESSAPDGTAGTVEVLEQSSRKVLNSFFRSVAIFGAPSVGHGFVVFGDALGHVTALVAPKYR